MFNYYSFKRNKVFYLDLMKLVVPMAFISLFNSLLNLTDNLMISRLGGVEVTAVGSSNKFFFVLMLTLFGINSGFGAFIAQFWGKRDIKRIHTVLFTALTSGVLLALVVTWVARNRPEMVIEFFSDDPNVLPLGVDYLRIVSFSYVISSVLFTLGMVSRSTERPLIPLMAVISGVFVNILLNWILIFGHLGFDKMGVEGAALATVIARLVQLLVYLVYILISRNDVLFIRPKNLIFESVLFKRLFYRTLPVVLNEFFWSLGLAFVFRAYGKSSEQVDK